MYLKTQISMGGRIHSARKQKKMTQSQLAEAVGVQRAVISKYENNMICPSLEMLKKLSNALDVSLSLLLGASLAPTELLESPEGFQTREVSGAERKILIEQLNQRSAQSQLLAAFGQLNDDGKKVAVERVEELTEIPKYKK